MASSYLSTILDNSSRQFQVVCLCLQGLTQQRGAECRERERENQPQKNTIGLVESIHVDAIRMDA